MSRPELLKHTAEGESIYYNKLTWLSAVLSAGGAIETCRAVAARKVRNAIAVIRPPGHHAECDQAMGFCLFNNVCIAARVCQREFGEACRKILIVDWWAIIATAEVDTMLTSIGMFTTVTMAIHRRRHQANMQ